MHWITESMDRFWQAYKDGLILSCPVHADCAREEAERKTLAAHLAAMKEKDSRSLH